MPKLQNKPNQTLGKPKTEYTLI